MKTKSTIAIIGNHRNIGVETYRFLAGSGQRLLLFDCGIPLTELSQLVHHGTEVDTIHCATDASWEADLIVIAVAESQLAEVCHKIKPYVTQKRVIVLMPEKKQSGISELLPDSKVLISENLPEATETITRILLKNQTL